MTNTVKEQWAAEEEKSMSLNEIDQPVVDKRSKLQGTRKRRTTNPNTEQELHEKLIKLERIIQEEDRILHDRKDRYFLCLDKHPDRDCFKYRGCFFCNSNQEHKVRHLDVHHSVLCCLPEKSKQSNGESDRRGKK
uniref:C2H2-type domain-containing protein n=1 Tax=Heterorhabditis bacteriophora TaxID=37862 RepID=A0A1I7XKI4_HETBA